MEPVEELLVMAPCEGLKPAMPNHSQQDEDHGKLEQNAAGEKSKVQPKEEEEDASMAQQQQSQRVADEDAD